MYIVAHKNHSNKERWLVYKDGAPIDLAAGGITKIEVSAAGSKIDSDSEHVAFPTVAVEHDGEQVACTELQIAFGALDLPPPWRSKSVLIIAYSASDTAGQVIVGPRLDSAITLEMRPNAEAG